MNARSIYLNVIAFISLLIMFAGTIYLTFSIMDYILFKMQGGIMNYSGYSVTNESVYLNKLFKSTGILIFPLAVHIIYKIIINNDKYLRIHFIRTLFMYVMRMITFAVALFTGIYVWNQGMNFINFEFIYFYSNETDYLPFLKGSAAFTISLIYHFLTYSRKALEVQLYEIKIRSYYYPIIKIILFLTLLIGIIILYNVFVDYFGIDQNEHTFNRYVLYEVILKSGGVIIPIFAWIWIQLQIRRSKNVY